MRNVTMLNMISIDGFFAGPNGEIDWFVPDSGIYTALRGTEEGEPGTLLCGRVTYQMLESYWPKVAVDPNAPEMARAMANDLNRMTKVVFSRTLKEVTWENSRLVNGNPAKEVKEFKQAGGPGMLIFGSGTIVQQLAGERLIDDYFLAVTPVVLGSGKPLFKDVNRLSLALVESRGFDSGNVLLHYKNAP